MIAEGWFSVCAALLVVSGGAKLGDPAPTRGALAGAGLPSSRAVVRALGVWEVVAGGAGLTAGGRTGGFAVALTYAGFAGFVAVALRRRLPIQSCGCFGRADTPPGPAHLAVNLSAAAAGVAVALGGSGGILDAAGQRATATFLYLGFVALGVFALYLLLAELPRTLALTRTPPAGSAPRS
jgi:hypothetical protein